MRNYIIKQASFDVIKSHCLVPRHSIPILPPCDSSAIFQLNVQTSHFRHERQKERKKRKIAHFYLCRQRVPVFVAMALLFSKIRCCWPVLIINRETGSEGGRSLGTLMEWSEQQLCVCNIVDSIEFWLFVYIWKKKRRTEVFFFFIFKSTFLLIGHFLSSHPFLKNQISTDFIPQSFCTPHRLWSSPLFLSVFAAYSRRSLVYYFLLTNLPGFHQLAISHN